MAAEEWRSGLLGGAIGGEAMPVPYFEVSSRMHAREPMRAPEEPLDWMRMFEVRKLHENDEDARPELPRSLS